MHWLRTGNGIPTSCTTTQQKCTGQPIKSAGSKNPLPLGMGSVKTMAISVYMTEDGTYYWANEFGI